MSDRPDVKIWLYKSFIEKYRDCLNIPEYQRPYVWDKQRINELLSDLKKSNNDEYYLGVILLHKEGRNIYNIIDGQQRIITLLTLQLVIEGEDTTIHNNNIPPLLKDRIKEAQEIINAGLISEYQVLNNLNFLDKLVFTVITTTSRDDAFIFFETQNNRGVKLGANDYLKAYNLRAINDPNIRGDKARQWEEIENLEPFLRFKFINDLLEKILWRSRNWKGQKNIKFENNDYLICEFEKKLKKADDYQYTKLALNKCSNHNAATFSLRQPFLPGLDFFSYVQKYAEIVKELTDPCKREPLPDMQNFRDFYGKVYNEDISIYLRELYLLCIVFYYDKFSNDRLFEFALWLDYLIGSIRVELQSIRKQRQLIFFHDIDNILDFMDMAYLPEEVINFIKYQEGVGEKYRKHLPQILNENPNSVRNRYIKKVAEYYGKEVADTGNKKEWIEEWIGRKKPDTTNNGESSCRYNSALISIEQIVKENEKPYVFNIPIYQRLYVWESEQIKILLEDLWTTYKNKEKTFYLGNVIVQYSEDSKVWDIVDGQQRFTTLWLLSIELSGALENGLRENDLRAFVKHGDSLRLQFAIREYVTHYFTEKIQSKGKDDQQENRLNSIYIAEKTIKEFLNEHFYENDINTHCKELDKEEMGRFAKYIYENIFFVLTKVPQNADLNKLFEIINNRGQQLQHHDILKARFLQKIDENTSNELSLFWNACSDMDHYIENNLKKVLKDKLNENKLREALKDNLKENELKGALKDKWSGFVKLFENNLCQITDLDALLHFVGDSALSQESYTLDTKGSFEESINDDVKSIISFPMLLLHTLRIYVKEKTDIEINEKKLLLLFEKHFFGDIDDEMAAEKIMEFFRLLWKVRWYFDKYIIKKRRSYKEDIHFIENAKIKDGQITRTDKENTDGFTLLQSILYHSQGAATHYWLTPLLNKMLECDDGNRDKDGKFYENYLRKLDNYCHGHVKSEVLPKERTWIFMTQGEMLLDDKDVEDCLSYLDEANGTAFRHYWFYKAEFVLWYYIKSQDKLNLKWNNKEIELKPLLNKFRITSRNSIEHISPQHPEENESNKVTDPEIKESFGNLALMSVSMNSEYSNKPYNQKRAKFWDSNSDRLYSIKMALIFENENWNNQICEEHRKKVKGYFEEYYREHSK